MGTTTKKTDGRQPKTDIHAHTKATYPLLFTFRDVVAGDDFWAGVSVEGRAVLAEDEDGAWFYGVQPGGLAGHGTTGQEAHQDFLSGYRSVLADLADLAKDFPAFETLAKEFLSTINRPVERQWEESVALVRAGKLELGWLPKRDADLKRKITIVELRESRATRAAINDPAASPLQSLAA